MKETDDRPIELLLRRHAQRNSGLPGMAAPSSSLSLHLDADELNALAENAVPASARARFNSHLVDCDHCRKLVSALSINASTASLIESEAAGVKTNKRSFWGMLATLFSLPLMRYGVPALTMMLWWSWDCGMKATGTSIYSAGDKASGDGRIASASLKRRFSLNRSDPS